MNYKKRNLATFPNEERLGNISKIWDIKGTTDINELEDVWLVGNIKELKRCLLEKMNKAEIPFKVLVKKEVEANTQRGEDLTEDWSHEDAGQFILPTTWKYTLKGNAHHRKTNPRKIKTLLSPKTTKGVELSEVSLRGDTGPSRPADSISVCKECRNKSSLTS